MLMTRDDELEFCIKNKITIRQFYILHMLNSRDFKSSDSVIRRYVTEVENFDTKYDLPYLEKNGFIDNFNAPGKYFPEMFMLTPKTDEIFATTYASDQFWSAYPGTFPIGADKLFIARSGMDMSEFQSFYLKHIDYSISTHKKALASLPIFVSLVNQGKLNGKKIVDFVKERGWESIPQTNTNEWGKDV